MDGRGGCCIARYGGYGPRYGLSKADRIMLRFRPIAPKPAATDISVGKHSPTTTTSGGSSDVSPKSGRGKRKYQKESTNGNNNNTRCKRKKRSEISEAVTLSLLPETPVFTDLNVSPKRNGPLWLSFSGCGGMAQIIPPKQPLPPPRKTVVVSSCVTVERVTDAWIDGYGLGKSNEEKKMNLMRDTCPGFISDGLGRVTWTNEAYRKMAKEDVNIPVEEGVPELSYDVIVRLVMKERPMLTYPAFTCRVRLQYTCQDRERGSVTVPCDVWRMDGGGFAWRLDVKAALCL